MRNNFFYILIICVFTEILTENEEEKPASRETIKHTREFYEDEAKNDIKNLLLSIKQHMFSAENEDNTQLGKETNSDRMMERIDKVLEKPKIKRARRIRKALRQNNLNYVDNFNLGNMQNLPYLVKSSSDSKIETVKSRISGGKDVKPLSRSQTSYVDIKPDIYPIFTKGNGDAKNGEMPSSEGSIRVNDQYYVNDNDGSIRLMNELDTNHKDGTIIGTSTPVTEKYEINEFLNQLRMKDIGNIRTQVSDNNFSMRDYFNNIYTQSANHMIPGIRLLRVRTHSNAFNDQSDLKDRDRSSSITLNNDVVKANSAHNVGTEEFMKYFNIENNLRTSQTTMSYQINEANKQGNYRNRKRRSINTQAGYTHDPDTCKTYNQNLAKLWSNLSTLINVSEQPNDRALHNIAMIIQAYLEHQNAKQTPEIVKEKHDGPRDKISEIIIKIRSVLANGDGSAEKITKIIKKYLKPDYTDAESEDCKEVNQEYLEISVDLLYKNYLENVQCQSEEDGMTRTDRKSLRDRNGRTSTEEAVVSTVADDFKPEYQTIHLQNELYNDFQKGKIPKRRPKNRRVYKSSMNQISRPAYRAGNGKSRSRSKSSRKKQKKSSLKSAKGRCETLATRQLIVSLRSVMERFNGLLECQLDNTLRSLNSDSQNRYYATKFYSEADSLRHKKMKSESPSENTGRIENNPHRKMHVKRRDTSIENDQDVYIRDDEESESIGESSLDQITSMKSATPSTSLDTNNKEPATDKKQQQPDYIAPPLYHDYDGVYKRHKVTHPSGNSGVAKQSKKTTRYKQTNKELASSYKEPENSDEYDSYYDEIFTVEPNSLYVVNQQKEPGYVETPFTDLTKLRSDDQLIAEKSKAPAKTFESIAEFFKKARDSSMQTPEFAVPFALDTNKGYVELTHLIKYPKIIVYRPQFLVKNTMPYDDFLKTINNINMTSEDVRLMKIVRHMPDSSVKVLFETEDFESPLEVRNLDEKNRRSGWPHPVQNYQDSLIDTANDSTNTDMTDEDIEDFMPFDESRIDLDELAKSNIFNSESEQRFSPDINTESEFLKTKEETLTNIYSENNSDSNSTLNSKTNSTESSSGFSSVLSLSSSLLTDNSSSDSKVDMRSAVGSDLGSQMSPGSELGLETLLKLGPKTNPTPNSQWRSFLSKLFRSQPKSHSQSHIDSQSSSGSSSISHSHARSSQPETDSSHQEVATDFITSASTAVLQWWVKWKTILKDKIQDIAGKMVSLANKIDHIIKI